MKLSVAETFYISKHRDVSDRVLADTLGKDIRSVRATLRKLPEDTSSPAATIEELLKGSNELCQRALVWLRDNGLLPAAPKRDGVANFATYEGVTSMTPRQAQDDDELNKSQPPRIGRQPGIHIINPNRPVR